MRTILTLTLLLASNLAVQARDLRAAADYSATHRGVSFLVMKDGRVLLEDYPNGGSADRAWELASGTKSFSGILAVAAAEDGFLKLDEKASLTLQEWRNDGVKAQITLRQLLSLTSGLGGGRVGRAPSYAEAIQAKVTASVGNSFSYGPTPFQVFGEILRRKLSPRWPGPLDYLKARVLDPAGVAVGSWRHGRDGQSLLPAGARLSARNWARFGELIRRGGSIDDPKAPGGSRRLLDPALLDQCFIGTSANPAYGLSFWLNRPVPAEKKAQIPVLSRATDLAGQPELPADLVMAAGAGDQRLYISRQRGVVIVRQADGILRSLVGDRSGFSDVEFLRRVFAGLPD
jgi:CubicO group peptidase (beta-lactamase class C family)